MIFWINVVASILHENSWILDNCGDVDVYVIKMLFWVLDDFSDSKGRISCFLKKNHRYLLNMSGENL